MAARNRRTFELRLGKLGLILFVGGISVLLFSMFLLGILVGKHMDAYPERYSAGMAEQIYDRMFASLPRGKEAPPATESGAKSDAAGGEEGFGLTFYDTLSGKRGETTGKTVGALKKEIPAGSHAPPPVLTRTPAIQASPEASAGMAAGSTALPIPGREGGNGEKVRSLPERRAAMESGANVSTAIQDETAPDGGAIRKGRFEVQVAAYQESGKAEKMIEKLAPFGFAPRVVMKELPGKGIWYRVIVGGFESREKAKAAADRIAGKIRGVKCVIRDTNKQ